MGKEELEVDEFWYAYVDIDESGNITDGVVGNNIMPTKQYDYFFFLEDNIDLMDYKVELEGYKARLIKN